MRGRDGFPDWRIDEMKLKVSKLKVSTDIGGYGSLKNREVVAGERYGDLVVVEELPGRRVQNSRAWQCRCVRAVDGRECGREAVKGTHQLSKSSSRACRVCVNNETRSRRRTYGSRFLTRR